MGVPQILFLLLYGLSAGTHLAHHGELRTGKYDFWSALWSAIIVLILLTWGGFFG